jgi:hypothetical protein
VKGVAQPLTLSAAPFARHHCGKGTMKPPARRADCGKLARAAGADHESRRYDLFEQSFSRCGERISDPLRVAPILTEPPGANNRPRGVIHSRARRESCVFHTVHNFPTFCAAGAGRVGRSRGPRSHSPLRACVSGRTGPCVDTSKGRRLHLRGSAPPGHPRAGPAPEEHTDSRTEWYA